MSKVTIMITTVILFAIAAVFGLLIIVPTLQGKTPSRAAVVVHGLLAASALVALILQVSAGTGGNAQISLYLFLVAAVGGFIMLARDLQKKSVPKALALVHAGVAVVAFLLLLYSIM